MSVTTTRVRDRNSVDSFTPLVTVPSKTNLGAKLNGTSTTLTPYAGTGAGSSFVPTAGAVYTDVDFGTTHLNCTSVVGTVTLNNVNFTNSLASATPMIINYGDTCTVIINDFTASNVSQSSWGKTFFQGDHITARRGVIYGFTDGMDILASSSNFSANGAATQLSVDLQDMWIGELSWFYNATAGIVHPSDTAITYQKV